MFFTVKTTESVLLCPTSYVATRASTFEGKKSCRLDTLQQTRVGGGAMNYLLVNRKEQLARAEAQPNLGSYLAVRQSRARLAPKTDNPRFPGLTFTQGVQAPVKRQEPPHLRQVSPGEKEEEKKRKMKTSLHEAGSLRRLCLVFLGRFIACNLTGRDRVTTRQSRRVSCCIFDGRSWRSASALLQPPLPF